MLVPVPAMSNVERQRLFRRRHPGYFRKYSGRRKADRRAVEARASLAAALAAAANAAPPAPAALPPAQPAMTIPPETWIAA